MFFFMEIGREILQFEGKSDKMDIYPERDGDAGFSSNAFPGRFAPSARAAGFGSVRETDVPDDVPLHRGTV